MIHFDGCPGFSGQKSFIEEVTFMWKFPRVSGFVDKEEKGRTGEEAAGARPGAGVAYGVWRMVMAREKRGTVWDPWK